MSAATAIRITAHEWDWIISSSRPAAPSTSTTSTAIRILVGFIFVGVMPVDYSAAVAGIVVPAVCQFRVAVAGGRTSPTIEQPDQRASGQQAEGDNADGFPPRIRHF